MQALLCSAYFDPPPPIICLFHMSLLRFRKSTKALILLHSYAFVTVFFIHLSRINDEKCFQCAFVSQLTLHISSISNYFHLLFFSHWRWFRWRIQTTEEIQRAWKVKCKSTLQPVAVISLNRSFWGAVSFRIQTPMLHFLFCFDYSIGESVLETKLSQDRVSWRCKNNRTPDFF